MRIMVIHAHTGNRGDEAAVKAMVDEINMRIPEAEIIISINGSVFYPEMNPKVKQIKRVPVVHSIKAKVDFKLMTFTKGKVSFLSEHKNFIDLVKSSDLVIHAPGGPSIGDIYVQNELLYLKRLKLVKDLGVPYMFYAPSMGPFFSKKNIKLRKEILLGAKKIILRDPISIKYLEEFIPEIQAEHALDSALQHDIDCKKNEQKLHEYTELESFLKKYKKVIGITITDLKWHPVHKHTDLAEKINDSFQDFIDRRIKDGYGIVFIPQLYGKGNDTVLMEKFMRDNGTFILDAYKDEYDTYFQQYVISRLFGVIGMRYHSNIFSAKMGTPFISVSYEQKMKGFMEHMDIEKYCLDVHELSAKILEEKFNLLEKDYEIYKKYLLEKHSYMKAAAYKSTEAVCKILL